MVNQSARWPLMSIYGLLTCFIGSNIQEYEVAALKVNYVVIVREAVTGPSLAYRPIKAAKTLFTDVCDHLPPRLPKIQDQKSLSLC